MPQPIDLQTELMRVTAAERVQHLANRTAQAVQQRAAHQQQQQQVEAESQVQEAAQAEQGRVDPDEKADERKRRKKKKEQAQAADPSVRTFYTPHEKPEVVEDPEEHRLDISI